MKNWQTWLTDKYIWLMLLIFPLWTGFRGYEALTVSKFAFFAAATGLWLAALAVSAVIARPTLPVSRPCPPAAAAFMLAACLSALFSPYGTRVLLGASRYDGLLTLLLYGGIMIGVSAFGRPRRAYVYALAVSATICCMIAFLQLLGGNPLGLFPGDYTYYDSGYKYSGAFLGTMGNTNVLAAFFCLCIPLFAGLGVLSRDRRDRLLLIPAALCLLILIFSGVSSGILAVGLCALLLPPYLVFLRSGRGRPAHICCAACASAAAGALAAIFFWPGTEGTMYELSQFLHGHIDDSFGSSRILIWRETLGVIAERPLLGGGPDTLTLRTDLDFSRYVTETGLTLKTHVDNAHNEYLNYLVNIGAAGFAAYLSVIAVSLSSWLRKRRGTLIPALGCGLVCYWIQSFFGLGLCLVVPLVWIFMGLVNTPSEE